MTYRQLYDFAVGQIEWYKKQIDFEKEQIEFCNRQIRQSRKEDRELQKFALSDRPNDPMVLRIYGQDYVGHETRKYINERARRYRAIKHNRKMIEHFRREAEEFGKHIG
jgi:hypothetical protein